MISLSSCPVHYRETAGDHVIKFLSFERLFSRDAEEGALPPRLGAASVLAAPSSLDSPPPVRRCRPQAAGAALPRWCLPSQLSLSKSCLVYLSQEAHAGGSGGAEQGRRQVLRSCVINRTGAEPGPALTLSVITAPGRPVLAQAHTAVVVPTFPGC